MHESPILFNLRLVNRVRAAPAEVLGDHSISRLRAFLDGHFLSCYEPLSNVVWFPIYDQLRRKYGIQAGAHGYTCLLLLISGGEAAALDRFFQELDEHLTFHRDQACDSAQWPYLPPSSARNWSLSDILTSAERGPAMLLGRRSITLMHAFLLGLAQGHRDAGRDISDLTKLEVFESWLNAQEKLRTWCRWDRILLHRSGQQEEDAVTMFLKEFRSFERHGG